MCVAIHMTDGLPSVGTHPDETIALRLSAMLVTLLVNCMLGLGSSTKHATRGTGPNGEMPSYLTHAKIVA